MNISEVLLKERNYFVLHVKATAFKRYFLYSGCLPEAAPMLHLAAVPVIAAVALLLPAPDAISFMGYKQ